MNKMLYKKMDNILRTEAQRTMENEKDQKEKIERINDIFNLKKIIDNYDELEPVLRNFFIEKNKKERLERQNE